MGKEVTIEELDHAIMEAIKREFWKALVTSTNGVSVKCARKPLSLH